MSSSGSLSEASTTRCQDQNFDDVEKGLKDHTHNLPILPPSAFWPRGAKVLLPPDPESSEKRATNPRPKVSRWILFQLWFNPYRKFFTFVMLLNMTGIIMAALGRFRYADHHLGALVLGNLLLAVLMRNELFLRFLYTIAIYGLRSVGLLYHSLMSLLIEDLVGAN